MGRRYWTYHLYKGPQPDQTPNDKGEVRYHIMHCDAVVWKGLDHWVEDADNPRLNCAKCLKLITGKAFAERKAAGLPPLELKKIDHLRYRYTYEAWLGGEHVGYVGMEAGWGSASWKIAKITCPRSVDEDPDDKPWTYEMGHEIGVDPDYEKRPHARFEATVYGCKEKALLAIPALVEAGKLKSVAQTIADGKAWVIRVRANRVAGAQKDAARKQARADMIEALQSIRDRAEAGEIKLTNSEIDGLLTAISKFEKIDKAPDIVYAEDL